MYTTTMMIIIIHFIMLINHFNIFNASHNLTLMPLLNCR